MAKNVTTIPATRNRFTADPISSRKKRRVAGYARVSTDMEDQQTSYAAQCAYYTNYIQECLETLRDLKANNAEEGYLKGLDRKIKDVEKYTVIGELTNAVFHTCGRMVLKLGIATTVLVGGALLAG